MLKLLFTLLKKLKLSPKKGLTTMLVRIVTLFVLVFLLTFLQQQGSIDFSVGERTNKILSYDIVSTDDHQRSEDYLESDVYLDLQNDYLESIVTVTGTLLFSPVKSQQNLVQWLSVIDQTQNILYGWLYHLTLDEVKALRLKKSMEGTNVRIILENNRYGQYKNTFKEYQQQIQDTDIELKNDYQLGVNFTHAKTFITDNQTIIQTANLTRSSFAKNIEHFFITTHKGIYQSILTIFFADRAGKSFGPEIIHPNLLICPTDCKPKLLYLLGSAQHSIHMYQQYITDDDIVNLLKRKEKKGVVLDLILPNKTENILMQKRFNKGSITIQNKPYIHSKTILIDDTYLIIGSMNMSRNSLENNREIGIVTTDKTVIAQRKKGRK